MVGCRPDGRCWLRLVRNREHRETPAQHRCRKPGFEFFRPRFPTTADHDQHGGVVGIPWGDHIVTEVDAIPLGVDDAFPQVVGRMEVPPSKRSEQ